MSFGSLCVCRFYATVKVDAVHGFPTEESIIPLGSQRERGRGGAGGGKLDKRRVVIVGTTLRKRPGLVVRRAGSYVLSTANGVFFLLFQRCFHSCVVQVHDMELCRHMTD